MKRRRWTLGDDDALRDAWATQEPIDDLAARLGRTRNACGARAFKLRLSPRPGAADLYSAAEDRALIESFDRTGSIADAVQAVSGATGALAHRSPSSLRQHLIRLRCQVEVQRGSRRRRDTVRRPCLGCGRDFQSEGIHHRLCMSCHARAAAASPLEPDFGRESARSAPRRRGA